MHRFLIAFWATASVLQAQPAISDVILKAMKEEIGRAKQLRIVGDPPYFIEYTVDDAEMFFASASYGGIVSDRTLRIRTPRVRLRVGDQKLDNSNHIYSDAYRGSRYDSSQLPLDDNLDALRIQFWLSTDRAYKQALEAFARKKASLKNVAVSADNLPDLWPAPAVSMLLPISKKPLEPDIWRTRIKSVSGLFSAFPEVLSSEVSVGISNTTSYLLNNEGTEFRIPDNLATFRIRANGLAADGSPVRDFAEFIGFEGSKLGSEQSLKSAATQIGENLRAMAKAPVLDSYSGPVLFEATAGPQILAEVLARNLTIVRRPVTDPDRPLNLPTGEFEGRIGSRVLPEWIDVVDDPTQKEYRDSALMGHYVVDVEGVIPKPLQMVEKGILKSFYTSRQPVTGVSQSNGHARLPGGLSQNAALAGNLFVKASQTTSVDEMKKKLLEICKQRSKPFGILVRKMDFPSTSSLEELRRIGGGQQGKAVSKPLLIYKIFPDGKEELVRGVRFRNFSARTLKDILAASDQSYVFQYTENGAPFAHMDAGGYVAPTSIVSPALLFDDVELEKIPGELPKLPTVAAPPLTQ